jgi:hypothetical protein
VAIAEAIAQVEKELKEKEPERFKETPSQPHPVPKEEEGVYKDNGPFSVGALALAVVGGVLLARFALRFFN